VKNEKFFDKPLTYLITGGEATLEKFSENCREILTLIEIAVESKILLIQIREKKLPARLVFELASKAAEITRNSKTKLLVNDRADIALAAKADGVHLTSVSMSAGVVRQNFPANFIIGVSAHSLEDAENAKKQGADFVTFSPIFPTPSKEKYGAPQGLEKLRRICEKLQPFPVIALGGIDETNYSQALKTGATGFAAIRFLNNAENLRRLALDLSKS
jgi:thiamine-phosphate pyrophosphorylase